MSLSVTSPHFSKASTPLTAYPLPQPRSQTSISRQSQHQWPSLFTEKNSSIVLPGATTHPWSLTFAGLSQGLGDNPSQHSPLLLTETRLRTLSVLSGLVPYQPLLPLPVWDFRWKNRRQATSLLQLPILPQANLIYIQPQSSGAVGDVGVGWGDLSVPPPLSPLESKSTHQLSPSLQASLRSGFLRDHRLLIIFCG